MTVTMIAVVVLVAWIALGLAAAGYVLRDEWRAARSWAEFWVTPLYVTVVALGVCVICGPWAWKIIRDCKREEARHVARG